MEKFKFLEHTADVKFRAFGKTIEQLFRNSALAMFRAMYHGKVKTKKRFKIKAKGKDFENLLYNFLEEFLYLLDTKNFFLAKLSNVKVDKKKFKIKALAYGDHAKYYEISTGIKAVTYNDMFIKKQHGTWVAQVVLDV